MLANKFSFFSIVFYNKLLFFFSEITIDPITQLLVTLRFYATGNFLITVGDFGGISVASAGKIVKRVSYALAFLSSR